jgi:hypothetical protein
MKASVVVLLLAVIGLGSLSATSCLVTRRSEGYACNTTSDCDDNRTCEDGYCVQVQSANGCPSVCPDCDMAAQTCDITCSAGKPCGSLQCPQGFRCTIRCTSSNSCGDIDCAAGHGCEINCGGASSCKNINCGEKPCDITCNGPASCPSIDCASSCKCDVDCNNTDTACPSISCPLDALGKPCTKNATAGETCDSSAHTSCDKCAP